MSIQAHLVHHVPGRVRLRVLQPHGSANGQIAGLADCLRSQSGIVEVRTNPRCASVIVTYEIGTATGDRVVQAAERFCRDSGRPAEDASSAAVPSGTAPAPRCTVVHATLGRMRLRLRDPAFAGDLAAPLEGYLRQQAGVRHARLNPDCASLVVDFDPQLRSHEELLALVQRADPERLRGSCTPVPSAPVAGLPARGERSSRRTLILSSASVLLGLWRWSWPAYWLMLRAAAPVFRRAFRALFARRKLNVDVLDAAAAMVLISRRQFMTASVMLWLISLGDFVRELTVRRSRAAIEGLFDGRDAQAWVVRRRRRLRIPARDVKVRDEVVVYPGEKIPVDGKVISGKAVVDQKTLTGESIPSEKARGAAVYAGTVVGEGKIHVRAERVGSDTSAARIVQMLLQAPAQETRIQRYEEQMADRFVPWSFLGAGVSYLVTGTAHRAASLLIIDFGTGIRVAAPTAVLASVARAARHGILVKGGRYLEDLAQIDVMVFDKTGTLTTGQPEICDVISLQEGLSANQLLALAAGAEQRLTHPVAKAALRAAEARGVSVPERTSSRFTIGLGVRARVNGSVVLVGSERFMAMKKIAVDRARPMLEAFGRDASSYLFVAVDGRLAGLLAYRDPLRPEAASVVAALRRRGVERLVMLTGDVPPVARSVAGELGIEDYVAEVFPDQKARFVARLQSRGLRVALVGDGINDAPALAQADVGIAMHGGAEVAQEIAHVTLLEADLRKIPLAIDVAIEAMALVHQGWRANFYVNAAAIALSLTGWTGPIATTLASNGVAVGGAVNSLRPLLDVGRTSRALPLSKRPEQKRSPAGA